MCVDEIDGKENETKKDKNKQSCSIENKTWATDPAALDPEMYEFGNSWK